MILDLDNVTLIDKQIYYKGHPQYSPEKKHPFNTSLDLIKWSIDAEDTKLNRLFEAYLDKNEVCKGWRKDFSTMKTLKAFKKYIHSPEKFTQIQELKNEIVKYGLEIKKGQKLFHGYPLKNHVKPIEDIILSKPILSSTINSWIAIYHSRKHDVKCMDTHKFYDKKVFVICTLVKDMKGLIGFKSKLSLLTHEYEVLLGKVSNFHIKNQFIHKGYRIIEAEIS